MVQIPGISREFPGFPDLDPGKTGKMTKNPGIPWFRFQKLDPIFRVYNAMCIAWQQSFPKKAYMWYQALFSTYKKRLFVTFYIILSVLTNKKIVRDNTLGNLVNGYWHNFDHNELMIGPNVGLAISIFYPHKEYMLPSLLYKLQQHNFFFRWSLNLKEKLFNLGLLLVRL